MKRLELMSTDILNGETSSFLPILTFHSCQQSVQYILQVKDQKKILLGLYRVQQEITKDSNIRDPSIEMPLVDKLQLIIQPTYQMHGSRAFCQLFQKSTLKYKQKSSISRHLWKDTNIKVRDQASEWKKQPEGQEVLLERNFYNCIIYVIRDKTKQMIDKKKKKNQYARKQID